MTRMSFRGMACFGALALGLPLPLRAAPGSAPVRAGTTQPVAEPEGRKASTTAVVVEVDVTKIDSFKDVMARRLASVASKRIAAGGLAEAATGRARIAIVVWPASAKRLGFDYSVSGWLDERSMNVTDNAGLCVPCMQEEVVERIDAVLTRQVAALRDAAAQPAVVAVATEPAPPAPTTSPAPGNSTQRVDRLRLTRLGGIGLGVGGVGVAGLIAGAVLLARGSSDGRGADDPRDVRRVDYRPGGLAGLGVGGALFVAGVAMLVTDVVRGRRIAKSRRSAWAPAVDRRGVGVVWALSF